MTRLAIAMCFLANLVGYTQNYSKAHVSGVVLAIISAAVMCIGSRLEKYNALMYWLGMTFAGASALLFLARA